MHAHELRQRREALGLSRPELARLTHLSVETIRKYEREERAISPESARVFEAVLWKGDDGRALRVSEVYSVVTDGANPERIFWAGQWWERTPLEEARKIAEAKAAELGSPVQIVLWRDRETVEHVQPPDGAA